MGLLTALLTGQSGNPGKAPSGGAGGSGQGGGLLGKLLAKRTKSKSSGSGSSSSTEGAIPGGGSDEDMPSYHKGGLVRKTGPARLRRGEHVLTSKQYKRVKHGRSKAGSK